ncbi:NUDIX hydrolase [Streptomyces endophyticus]|uniref:NUDIX hydrolase n=1 Tax=Streptomyces endophyticus TaxID=714166 RepID=UPI002DB69319|nr:NUDIX hydrolase [Streptomyces endophyticus]
MIAALDDTGKIAILRAPFPDHGGDLLFFPGGRREGGEDALTGVKRELKEEAGVTASSWTALGNYAMTLASTARIHLFLAQNLTLGPQELTENEQDFKLDWWPLDCALDAAEHGRFLLPAGPLALLLTTRRVD